MRGKISSVKEETVRSADFRNLAEGNPSIDVRVAYVTLNVVEVLRGPALPSEWRFMVYQPDNPGSEYPIGAEMVICGFYHQRLDVYYHTVPESRYKRVGDAWVTGSESTEARMTDAGLRKDIADVEIANVARQAQLVVEGVIESVNTSVINGPDGAASELVTLTLRVDQVMKGQAEDRSIKVVVITRGMYSPQWRKEVPAEYKVGQRWLCMLNHNEYGWYPLAGSNGFLRVEGTNLIYAERVPYWRTKKDVEKYVKTAAAGGDR